MNHRLEQLDFLRGLAALTVVFGHFMATLPATPWWAVPFEWGPLHIVTAGHQAVVFFFVLSGFVLSLPFLAGRPTPYPAFLLKRVLRIYPPYLCAAAAAFFFREWPYSGPVPGVGAWFNTSWGTPVTWSIVKNYIVMIGPFRGNDFIPVLWSLVHEMRISIFFPALVFLVIRKPRSAGALAFAAMAACLVCFQLRDSGRLREPQGLQTLEYVDCFIVGALLAKYRAASVRWFGGLAQRAKWGVLTGGVLLYTYVFWLPALAERVFPGAGRVLATQVWEETVTMGGVCLFIIAALASRRLARVIGARPIRFLGATSYSLYLYHAICLKVAVTALQGRVTLGWALLIALAASFAVSAVSYKWVEQPSIRLGQRLARRFFPGPSERAAVETKAG